MVECPSHCTSMLLVTPPAFTFAGDQRQGLHDRDDHKREVVRDGQGDGGHRSRNQAGDQSSEHSGRTRGDDADGGRPGSGQSIRRQIFARWSVVFEVNYWGSVVVSCGRWVRTSRVFKSKTISFL